MVSDQIVEFEESTLMRSVIDGHQPAVGPFDFMPACLLPLGSRPIIEHVIAAAVQAGAEDVLVNGGSWAPILDGLLRRGVPWDISLAVASTVSEATPVVAGHRIMDMPLGVCDIEVEHSEVRSAFDVSTLEGLRDANLELLSMRTTDLDEPALKRAPGCLVSTSRARISKRAKLIPPVIIGQDVTVAAGACVGPFAVLTDGVVMAKNSRLQFGILAGGMTVESGGLASGVIGVGGVVARVPFPGCRESLVRGVGSLPASRRYYGTPLPKGTMAPRA